MAPKRITVIDASGRERMMMLGSQDGYRDTLSEFHVAYLKHVDGFEIRDFESLQDGNTYTLGQQRDGALRRCCRKVCAQCVFRRELDAVRYSCHSPSLSR
jgi:hypothetical protein